MKWTDRLVESFSNNPIAWLAVGLFLFAEYSNYQHSDKLHRICELVPRSDFVVSHPTTTQGQIDQICGSVEAEPDDNSN